MATGDTYRLAVETTFTGTDQIVNVFHYRQTNDAGGTANKAMALILAWQNSAEAAYLDCLSSRITMVSLAARGVAGSTEEAELADASNGNGGNGDIVPLTSAPLISWRSGQAGRRKRGRTYMPPAEELNQDAGNLSAGYLTILEAFVTAALVISGIGGLDEYELVIFSPENLIATPPRVGTVITPVTAGLVANTMAVQRRRKQGVGS